MAKKNKEEFELDDWDFDSDLDFPDFDAEPGSTSNNRSPVAKVTKGAWEGMKTTALDPSFAKEFMKKSLPTEYGNAFTLAETVGTTSAEVYREIQKEFLPAVNEAKKVGKKLAPMMKGILPESLAEKLDNFLTTEEDKRSSTPSQEQLIETSINSTLGEIFKTQAEQQDAENKQRAEEDLVRDTANFKYQKDSLVSFSGMTTELKKLTSYQEKVTVNWQRKTLELQLRQYFIQRESLEEQKKTSAMMQTNLEGILKNTALPEFVKIKQSEALRENMRNKFHDRALSSLMSSRSADFIRSIGAETTKQLKRKVTDTKEQVMEILAGVDMFADASEMSGELGKSKEEMLAELAGQNIFTRGAYKAASKIRDRLDQNRKLKTFGKNTSYKIGNLRQIMKENAANSFGEDRGGITGAFFEILNNSVRSLDNRDTKIERKGDIDNNAPAIFDNRLKRTLTDVIPAYLARMDRGISALAMSWGVSAEELKDVSVFDWKENKLTKLNSIRARHGARIKNEQEARDYSSQLSNVLDKEIERFNSDAEYEEGVTKIEMSSEEKTKLLRHLAQLAIDDKEIDPAKLQDEFYWKQNIKNIKKEEIDKYIDFFSRYGKSKGLWREEYSTGFKGVKEFYQDMLKDDGVDRKRFFDKFSDQLSRMGSGVTNKLKEIQEYENEYGHLDDQKHWLNANGSFDEKAYQLSMFKGYRDTGVFDYTGGYDLYNKLSTVPNLSKKGRNAVFELKALEERREQLLANTPDDTESIKAIETDIKKTKGIIKSELKKVKADKDLINSFANGGVVGTQYLATGGVSKYQFQSGYTGKGSKWQEKPYQLHAGEVVFSQDDIKRAGGLEFIETIRKEGKRGITRLGEFFKTKAKAAGQFAGELNNQVQLGLERNEVTEPTTLEKHVASIHEILQKGIPVSGFTDMSTKGITEVPWYLRSFGSVIGDLAALPFKAVKGVTTTLSNGLVKGTGFIGKGIAKTIGFGKSALTLSRKRVLDLKEKAADKFDVFVKGEVKPRLSAILLKTGQYYNEEGKQIKSWSDITGAVFKLEDGEYVKVFDKDDIKNSIALNYNTGKAVVMDTIIKTVDWGKDRIKDFAAGFGHVGGLALEIAKFGVNTAKSYLYRPEDVYVKDKIDEGPRLLAMLMRKDYYVSKNDTSKFIKSPADIDGPVLDKEGNIALSMEDIRQGLVDKFNKPLRIGALSKIFGKANDVIGGGINLISNTFKGIKNGAKSLFGGVKNFFAAFFGDGGVIFANSNKLLDKLEAIRLVLDERLPGGKPQSKSDKDGDGIRDGSIAELREKNRLAKLAKKEQEIKERQEQEERNKQRRDDFKNRISNPFNSVKKMLGLDTDEDKEETSSGRDIYIDAGDGDSNKKNRRKKTRGEKLKQRARIAKNKAARKGKRLLGGRRMPKVGKPSFGMPKIGIPGGVKGLGAGLLLAGASTAANAAGMEGLGGVLDTASTVVNVASTASMASSALGMGGLTGLIGAAGGAVSAIGGAVATGASAAMTGLASAATFLATNPVGWAILAGGALAYGAYKLYQNIKSNKFDSLGKFRYAQYGFNPEESEYIKEIKSLEEFFLKEHVTWSNGRAVLQDNSVDIKKFFGIFDVDLQDRDQCLKVLKWYNERFKPIFTEHLSALKRVSPNLNIHEAEAKLSAADFAKLLEMVRMPQGPYGMMVSPFKELAQLEMDATAVESYFNKLKEETNKRIEKEGGKKPTSTTMPVEDTAGKAIAGATAMGVVKNMSNNVDKNGSGLIPNDDSGHAMDTYARMAKSTSQAAFLGATAASAYTTIKSGDAANTTPNLKDKLSAIAAIKLKAYGLREFDTDKVTALLTLEHRIVSKGFITLELDKKAIFNGDLDLIAKENADSFGINVKDVGAFEAFKDYLTYRFIPVLLAYITTVIRLTNTLDIAKTLDDSIIKDKYKLAIAQAVIGAKYQEEPVWTIAYGLWKGYNLNTDSSTVNGHLSAIKEKLGTKSMVSEYSDKPAHGLTQEEKNVLNANEKQKAAATAKETVGDTPKEKGFFDKAKDAVSNAWDNTKRFFGDMYNGAKDNVQKAAGVVGGVIDGMKDMGQSAIDAITGGGDSGGSVSKSKQKYLDALYTEIKNAGITDKTELASFLANIDHETGGLNNVEENTNYRWERFKQVFGGNKLLRAVINKLGESAVKAMGKVGWFNIAYGNLMGNNSTDEGYKYRGRGLIQLTGKSNYQAFAKASGIDVVNNPDLVATDPTVAAKSAIWFWKTNKLDQLARNGNHIEARRRINGGQNGMEDYKRKFTQYYNGQGKLLSGGLKGVITSSTGGKTASTSTPGAPNIEDERKKQLGLAQSRMAIINNPNLTETASRQADWKSDTASQAKPTVTTNSYTPPTASNKSTGSPWDKARSSMINNSGGYANKQGRWTEQDPDTREDKAPTAKGSGNVPTNSRAYRAAEIAARRAKAKSSGYCSRYVADALQQAGYKFTRQPSAYMYATNGIMKSMGFTNISMSSPRQIGDVIVWSAHGGKGGGGKHGHIQIYTSKGWVSDFVQSQESPGPSYRNGRSKPTLWRDSQVLSTSGGVKEADSEGVSPQDLPASYSSGDVSQDNILTNDTVQTPTQTRDTWSNIRKGDPNNPTIIDSYKLMSGEDTSVRNSALQKEAIREDELNGKNKAVVNVLVESLTEHQKHTKLLETIAKSLGAQVTITEKQKTANTATKEAPKVEATTPTGTGKVTTMPPQKTAPMNPGKLDVGKALF